MILANEIVLLDKDGTLGDFYDTLDGKDPVLYPGVPEFLDLQKQKGRRLYIATAAGDLGEAHLVDIADKLDGYFGKQQINSATEDYYVLPDGHIRKVKDDYDMRILLESKERQAELDDESLDRSLCLNDLRHGTQEREELQTKINGFFEYWQQLYHKETRQPLDKLMRYANPHVHAGRHGKDLYLARRLISPVGFEDLRSVLPK